MFSFKLKNLRSFRENHQYSCWCTVIIVFKIQRLFESLLLPTFLMLLASLLLRTLCYCWRQGVSDFPAVAGDPAVAGVPAVVGVRPTSGLLAVVGVLVANVSPDCFCCCLSPWCLFAYSYMLLPWHAQILVESLLFSYMLAVYVHTLVLWFTCINVLVL
jgi:hypothetical protein